MQMGQPMMAQPGMVYQDPMMMQQPMAMAPMPQVVTTVTTTTHQQDPFVDKNGCTEDQMDEEFRVMAG